jgi:hypothetical protein
MSYEKKKQIFLFTNGSTMPGKTCIKASNRLKFFDKDHITFGWNQKNKELNKDFENLNKFKLRYLQF